MAAQIANDDELITGINVTPLVDITLVLLVILMVTASYVTSRAIPVELPKGATGEGTPTTLTISIDKDGKTFSYKMGTNNAKELLKGAKKVPKGTLFFIGENGQLYMRTGPYLEGDGKFKFGPG